MYISKLGHKTFYHYAMKLYKWCYIRKDTVPYIQPNPKHLIWDHSFSCIFNLDHNRLALSSEVTCNFRRTIVKPSWKLRIFTATTASNRCLHTGVPYNTAYGLNVQCSLFTYTWYFFCLTDLWLSNPIPNGAKLNDKTSWLNYYQCY